MMMMIIIIIIVCSSDISGCAQGLFLNLYSVITSVLDPGILSAGQALQPPIQSF